MRSRDTSPEAAALHLESQRRLGPVGRLKLALELSDLTHTLAIAGIRHRHPEYTHEQACRELARVLYTRKA